MQLFTKNYLLKGLSRSGYFLSAIALLLTMLPATANSQTALRLVIQPIQSEEKTREIFQPLADYMQSLTGQEVEIITYPNFISYWTETKKTNSYDIAFDAAHFLDYRNKNIDFTVLAKQPGSVSISLIVSEDALVFEPEELIGKKIATLGPPSIAASRINEIFNNPLRQPTIIEANDSSHIMELLMSGEVDAAMLPTPLVSARMSGDGGIAVVLTTEPVPSMGISVSPVVSSELRETLAKGLIEADKTDEGKKMLSATKLNPFEKTNNQEYFGFDVLLQDDQ
ncbi:MAG: phosphate/phosphite/phosphonate ABC transporter substrate-binding protein [Arenicellales bacterium]